MTVQARHGVVGKLVICCNHYSLLSRTLVICSPMLLSSSFAVVWWNNDLTGR